MLGVGVLPLTWSNCDGKWTAAQLAIEVYMVTDGSWRVWFQFGDKVRNLPDLASAQREAQRLWDEWVMSLIDDR